ncbi:BrnA antitoxin family protein [Aquamicrobium segne]|uniref:BrnA antitoxin family protein n=1 Tax=Aquamicrobium segne TaxID=469547 RepID=A0ABW0H111_9HYPH
MKLTGCGGTYRNSEMSIHEKRFSMVLDPTNLWTVWDNQEEIPAMFGDRVLCSLSENEAHSASDVLNAIDDRRRWLRPVPAPQDVSLPMETVLEAEVIAKFKATGPGWQSRINDLLRAVKL